MEKRDSKTGERPQGNADFSGITFEVVNSSRNPVEVEGTTYAPGQVVATLVTDESGHASTEDEVLPYGTYTVREVATNESMLQTFTEQTVQVREHKKIYVVTAENEVVRGGLAVEKRDSITGSTPQGNADFSGITFEIINDSKNPVIVNDTVSYTGLTPGKTYKLSGVLMDKSTGGKLLVDGKEVTAEKEFTPENASGTEEIKFILDASVLAGKSVVVFETLYFDSKEVASHTDINDEGQTVEFDGPEIKTKATVGGEKEVDPLETITLTDTVTYRNLIPGKTYQVKGVLMDKGTGSKLLADGKEVTAEAIFIPEKPNGTVEMSFTFPASALAGKTIVVFESVYHEGKEIAVHADLEDKDQTIIIRRKGGLLIRKTSEDDFVEGISFIVAGNGYEETFVTDKQGQIYVQDLVPGEYTITEVENDVTAKYIIEAGKTVTITPNDEPAEIEFHNKLKRGSVYIVKTAGGAPGKNLPGAEFAVYADVDGNAEFDPETDTLFGKLKLTEGLYSLSGLPVGGYFLHEEKAPEGYTADDGYYYFKLTEEGERVEVTNTGDKEAGFVNEKQTGSLRIVKVEKGTTTPLAV